jgi:hypothetical protein
MIVNSREKKGDIRVLPCFYGHLDEGHPEPGGVIMEAKVEVFSGVQARSRESKGTRTWQCLWP